MSPIRVTLPCRGKAASAKPDTLLLADQEAEKEGYEADVAVEMEAWMATSTLPLDGVLCEMGSLGTGVMINVALISGWTLLTTTPVCRRRPSEKTERPDASAAQFAALPSLAAVCAADTVVASNPSAMGTLPRMLILVMATRAMIAKSHLRPRNALARAPGV